MKIKVAILKNELPDDHLYWIRACEELSNIIEFHVVDLTLDNWLEIISHSSFDFYLAKPGAVSSRFKLLYDERVFIIEKILGLNVFPSATEIFVYENKRFLSYWLQANKIPHPITHVFYHHDEVELFLKHATYPIVGKTNIGASGSGVIILKNAQQGAKYVRDTFDGRGATQRTGPNLNKGGIFERGFNYILHPEKIKSKLNIYKIRADDLQKGFVIFQEYIQHVFEWRVVRIGNSFFAHKKLLKGDKASGSLLKGYQNPPLELFDFVKEITDKYAFYSQAVDLFETSSGFLVNEMQCLFGQSDPYQMLVDGIPGRYRYINNCWVFEEGDFARNACYNLRLEFLYERFVHKQTI
jgi:glutathione synthase/RimK-type ligase-like ATP-grasp enzyme